MTISAEPQADETTALYRFHDSLGSLLYVGITSNVPSRLVQHDQLAPVGSTVNLVSDRTQAAKDRYGRLLRYVKRQGGFNDLSYRQAFNGYTKRYVFGGKPVARDRDYVRAITSARNNNRGLWNSCW